MVVIKLTDVWGLIAIITPPKRGRSRQRNSTLRSRHRKNTVNLTIHAVPPQLQLCHTFMYKFNIQRIITQTKYRKSQNMWFSAKMIK